MTRNDLLSPDMLLYYTYLLSPTEAHMGRIISPQDLQAFVADPMRLANLWREQEVLLLLRIEDLSAAEALIRSNEARTVLTYVQSHGFSQLRPAMKAAKRSQSNGTALSSGSKLGHEAQKQTMLLTKDQKQVLFTARRI